MSLIEMGFLLLSLLMIIAFVVLLKKYGVSNLGLTFYILGVLLWLIYNSVLSRTEVLQSLSLPPRLAVFVVIPILIFVSVLVFSGRLDAIIKRSLSHQVIVLQSFRILVELLIFGAFLEGVFPKEVSFEGINYDIFVGISALVIGFLEFRKKLSARIVLVWNFAGLAILGVTVYSFMHSFYFGDFVKEGMLVKFVQMPYLLLASFLMPTAVFLHFFSIRKQHLLL